MGRRKKDISAESLAELEQVVKDFRDECDQAIKTLKKAGEVYAQRRSEIINKAKTVGDPSIEDERLINPNEASVFIGKTKTAIYNMVHRQQIPYIKRGKLLFFRKKDLKSWMLGKSGNEIVESY